MKVDYFISSSPTYKDPHVLRLKLKVFGSQVHGQSSTLARLPECLSNWLLMLRLLSS